MKISVKVKEKGLASFRRAGFEFTQTPTILEVGKDITEEQHKRLKAEKALLVSVVKDKGDKE